MRKPPIQSDFSFGRCRQRGLTLIEMLIAMTIFSVLAGSCVVVLRMSINADEQLKRSSDLAGSFQIARTLIKSDLAQIVPRASRGEFGRVRPGPVVGGAFNFGSFEVTDEGETLLLSLIRNGRSNPQAVYPRSTLQYVEYLVRDREVIRRTWPHTDILEETEPSTRVVFDRLDKVKIRFLDGEAWVNQWRSRDLAIAPRAVELTFEHDVFGEMRQVFYVGEVTG